MFQKYCKTLGDWRDFYVLSDTLLLADVFEKFRSEMLRDLRVDPAHYLTLPIFGWQAILKGNYRKEKEEVMIP